MDWNCIFRERFSRMLRKHMVWMNACAAGMLLARPSLMMEEEEEPVQGLKIESQTDECSADYYLAREEGKDPDEDKTFPPPGGRHRPGMGWSQMDPGNRIIDTIGWRKTMGEVKAGLSPDAPEQEWEWLCERYVQSILHQGVYLLGSVTQRFKIRWADPRTRQAVHAWISKFGCQVERDSQQGIHTFSPQDEK